MMSHHTPTPAPTPIKDSGSHHSKKLPLIVDIAIDNNGKQLYQVHESSKSVRREMPRSTNFSNAGIHIDDGSIFMKQEEKTPIRRVLGTLSPSTLNQKKGSEDEYDEPELATRKDSNGDYTSADETGTNMFSNFDQDDFTQQPVNVGYPRQLAPSKGASDNDIWSEDVEQAFEEVLSIIPKNGLNKIKISGRSCGRNELISDYIYTKTGKFRTRKQVSSHIQVIKNLGQKLNIIRLINEGPSFESEDAQADCNKKFEEIFSKINMNKSLGFNDNVPVQGLKRKSTSAMVPQSNSHSTSSKRIRRRSSKTNPSSSLHISFQGFFMSIDDSFSSAPNPFILTVQDSNHEVKKLVIKENASITNRFPRLDDFQSCSNIPIIHNMVKIHFTNFTQNYSVDDGFRSNFSLRWDDLEESSRQYSSFTCIYSFGKEVLKFTEEGFKFNENRTFLVKFWKFFLSKLVGKEDKEVNLAFKGMTIKQIIFENENIDLDPAESLEPTNVVPKSKIKLVLLWEFAKVIDFKDAATTTSKLILPSKILASNDNIIPQMVDYPQPSSGMFPDSATVTAVSTTPNVPYQSQTSYMGAPQLNHGPVHNVPVMQTPGSVESPWAKSQVSAQMKFQNLQQTHLQPTQLSPQQQQLQQLQHQQQSQQHFAQFPFQTPVSSMLPQPPFASQQVLNQVQQQHQQHVVGQPNLINSGMQQYPVQGNHGPANIDLGMIPTPAAPEAQDYSLQPAYSEGFYQ